MAWKKAPDWLVTAFGASLPDDPRVLRRQMFGYPCSFVGGNMYAGLFEERVVVRLSDADREALGRIDEAAPFEPMGRPMRGYMVLPEATARDARGLRDWLGRAFTHVSGLPVKVKKTAGSAKKDTVNAKNRTSNNPKVTKSTPKRTAPTPKRTGTTTRGTRPTRK